MDGLIFLTSHSPNQKEKKNKNNSLEHNFFGRARISFCNENKNMTLKEEQEHASNIIFFQTICLHTKHIDCDQPHFDCKNIQRPMRCFFFFFTHVTAHGSYYDNELSDKNNPNKKTRSIQTSNSWEWREWMWSSEWSNHSNNNNNSHKNKHKMVKKSLNFHFHFGFGYYKWNSIYFIQCNLKRNWPKSCDIQNEQPITICYLVW